LRHDRPVRRTLTTRLLEPLAAPWRTARQYRLVDLRGDLSAGLTSAVVDFPQAMALSLIAGVPPIHGVYAAIVLGFVGALFTSSRVLAVGPTNTQSLVTAAIVSRLTGDPELYLQLVFGLTVLKGIFQLAFGAAGVGRVARFLSRSVMIGFTAAAGVLIVVSQLAPMLGLDIPRERAGLPGVIGAFSRIAAELAEADPRALALFALSLALMLASRRLSPLVPGPLLALVAGALAVSLFRLGEGADPVALAPALPRGLPRPALPQLTSSQIETLLAGAVALALLGALETVSIGRTAAGRTRKAINPDQEFFSQGLANLIGGVLQCLPGSASFSRTALLVRAGAQTRFAGLYGSVLTALMLLVFADLGRFVPLASLAAVLSVIGISLIDLRAIARISAGDALVCLSTLAAALLLPLAYAIYVGVFLNLAVYLRKASHLHVHELVPAGDGTFAERPLARDGKSERLVFLQLEGDLFFAVADELAGRLTQLADDGARVVILRLKRAHWVDASVLFVLDHFAQVMRERGGYVILCGVRPELRTQLHDFGLSATIGEENILGTQPGVFASARAAYARGEALLLTSLRPGPPAQG
jgi:sulfate permease, SulP family